MDKLMRDSVTQAFGTLCNHSFGVDVSALCKGIDDEFQRIDSYIHKGRRNLVSIGGVDVISCYELNWGENVWKDVITSNGIPIKHALMNLMERRSKTVPIDPTSIFLDTWKIDDSAPYHGFLLGRGAENATYGTLHLYEWFGFLAGLTKPGSCIELSYLAGIVDRYKLPIFKSKHADKSVIDDVQGFYNMPNIVESLLNICVLRLGMEKEKLCLSGHDISLYSVLDELALRVCVSPKIIMNDIRKYLVYVVRYAGILTEDQVSYFSHGSKVSVYVRSYVQERVIVDNSIFSVYKNSTIFNDEIRKGREKLKALGLHRLNSLCDVLLSVSLKTTEKDHFIIASKFLLSLLAIPGYGRALNFSSSPRSGPEQTVDELGIAHRLREMILHFHNCAVDAGYDIVHPNDWKITCISFWKSTGAGVDPEMIDITVDGEERRVKATKKPTIGAIYGDRAFRLATLDNILTRESPGSVGYRDVPGKSTRAIYVLRLPTLHAQVAVVHHLVNYVSTRGVGDGDANIPFNASHIHSGPGTTTGMRIFDNLETIKASSSVNDFYIGTDLSSYDSNNVIWNFREPMISALKQIGEHTNYEYGTDKIPWKDMVDKAFGPGHVLGTMWDNGREPIVYSDNEICPLPKFMSSYTVGKTLPKVRPLPGVSAIKEGSIIWILDVKSLLESGGRIPWDVCKVGFLKDGKDFVYLTSEASGELSTLMMNSLMNLAMQSIIRDRLCETKFGSRIILKKMKAVGDDSEWIGSLKSVPESYDEIDDFLKWLKEMYRKMGHVVKEENMILIPLGSEFVQTFAKFGLYIPRDLISVIPSEKPRKIVDRLGFVRSFRNVLLSKIARGFSSIFSNIIFLYIYRKLSSLDLRRHKIQFRNSRKVLANDNSGRAFGRVRVDWQEVVTEDISVIKLTDFKKEKIYVFVRSVMCAMLPNEADGVMWSPISLCIYNFSAFFLYQLGLSKSQTDQSGILITLYAYMLTRYKNDSKIKYTAKVSLEKYKLSISDIFPPSTCQFLLRKPVRIGHLDGLNVPERMVAEGLKMEKFMQPFQSLDLEVESENFLDSYNQKIRGVDPDRDSWLLNYAFNMKVIDGEAAFLGSLFYGGLSHEFELIKTSFGLIDMNFRLSIHTDNMRILISRDPALRNVLSPESLISLLQSYGINDVNMYEEGMMLLACTGMRQEVASSLLKLYFSDQYGGYPSSTGGAFSDDFCSSLSLVNVKDLMMVDFPTSFTKSQRIHCMIHSAQISVATLLQTSRAYKLSSVTPLSAENLFVGTYPNTHALLNSRAKNSTIRAHNVFTVLLREWRDRDVSIVFKDSSNKLVVLPPRCGKTTLAKLDEMMLDVDEFIRDAQVIYSRQTLYFGHPSWFEKLIRCYNSVDPALWWNTDKIPMVSSIQMVQYLTIDKLHPRDVIYIIPNEKFTKKLLNTNKGDIFKQQVEDIRSKVGKPGFEVIEFASWSQLRIITSSMH
uniref:RNA-dependent RNA polymerase n=1 Tax=Hubei reo-like virus 12 TaxID=1923175 RepID=A0A8B0RK33_9VIRU|nr:RNA-dependent RNA polymerase [Hubei reo-like virus 12]